MHPEYDLSIITINYNGLKDTCELIETLPLDLMSLEVIVVDNASTNDEATIIEQRFPTIKVIRSNTNLGFAGGNNLGLQSSHGKNLFFINNDTIFKGSHDEVKEEIQNLIRFLNSSEKIGMVCPKIRFTWGNSPIQFAGYTTLSKITVRNKAIGCGEEDTGQYEKANPTPYAHGAAMMVKREVIEKAGIMPECYFLYYEELDWSMMIRRAGYQIWYSPVCTIFHKESQATGQHSPLRTFYLTRNRLLFVRRNAKQPLRLISYTYLIGIVAVKDMLKFSLQKRKDLAQATFKGVVHFFK